MAQSPSDAAESSEIKGYLESWGALASMIVRGRSLSGHERNCAFLNIGLDPQGSLRRFADVSASSGLDLSDDSRAISAGDWDGDGDLDLWITNREAPRVRFLRNNLAASQGTAWVSFALQGSTSNRDAIGAVLEFEYAGRKLTRSLAAGDGFLSQSSKRVFFGLGPRTAGVSAGRLSVRWPGGPAETFEEIALNQTHRIIEGSAKSEPLAPPKPVELASLPLELPPATDQARIVLTQRIEAPAIEYVDFQGELRSYDPKDTNNGPTLINMWASWCAPCVAELADFKANFAQLKERGLNLIALTTEAVSPDGSKPDITDAKTLVKRSEYPFIIGATDAKGLRALTVLHNTVIVLERPLPLPSSFLFDRFGRLAIIYKGPVRAEQLQADLDLLEAAPATVVNAAFPFPSQSGFELFGLAHLDFAKAYQEGGYLDDARRSAHLVIDGKPSGNAAGDAANRASAWYYLGTLEQGERNWGAAAAAYGKAIEFAPRQPLLEVARGVVLWQSGDKEGAEASFSKAARAAPGNPQLLDALAKANLQIDRAPEAIRYLEQALTQKPGDLTLMLTLALAYEKAGEAKIALSKYRELLEKQAGLVSVKNNLAFLLATSSDESVRDGAEALKLAREVVQATKTPQPATLDTLAAAQAESGDFQAAVVTIDQALVIARATGQEALIERFREKRMLYQSEQPFRSE